MKTYTIATHSGGFHADDVFAVATIILSLEEHNEYAIIRTRDESVIAKADFVVDVGGVHDVALQRFDHHQAGGAGTHDNGIPYASFGLVWKEYGEKICGSSRIAHVLETRIVMPIDALDNGVEITQSYFEHIRPFSISDYLYSYWIDEQNQKNNDVQIIFEEVVMLAKNLILRLIDKEKHIEKDEMEVLSLYDQAEDKRVLVLPRDMAWGTVLISKPETLFVVYPSSDGVNFRAKAVRVVEGSFETRKSFPQSWAGKKGAELEKETGVPGSVFCHNERFIAVADSLEGAKKLAYKALDA